MDDVRTPDHNARFHRMVRDIARQVKWAGEFIHEEDFKRLLLAAKFGQKVVPNPLDPMRGFVVMNTKRSKGLTNTEMEEFMGELQVFGDENNVKWTDDEN